jgi:deoxyribodipyrimidine photo-lyase
MSLKNPINIFWFRRDLRLNDNTGLFHALKSGLPLLALFIFDTDILGELVKNDPRVSFIYDELTKINLKLREIGSKLMVRYGKPSTVWRELIAQYNISEVFANRDYEPYAIVRDEQTEKLLQAQNIGFHTFKDQVIFEKSECIKADGNPYTVYTPYMKKWMSRFQENQVQINNTEKYFQNFLQLPWSEIALLEEIGFLRSAIKVPELRIDKERIDRYEQTRNFPYLDGTSMAGIHLRFGTVSIREIIKKADSCENKTFLKELVWREFFMQILFHFPKVIEKSFKPAYDKIRWLNNEDQFQKWIEGKTGYPFVDAGMHELDKTGIMHNRVRMVVASFLCKHLLIDWRWGEAYFAKKLLDYELSSNNGNWQWASGSGCDAAPYFRIFNPAEQMKKFDPDMKYVKKWVSEWGTRSYPGEIIEHKYARTRAITHYNKSLAG